MPALSGSVAPIAVNARGAAYLLNLSAGTFQKLVEGGVMPKPRRIGTRVLWDLEEVRAAFRSIPQDGQDDGRNSWSDL